MKSKNRASRDLSKSQFAQLCATELKRMGETGRLRYDPPTFSLTGTGPNRTVAYLGHVYAEYTNAQPPERSRILRRYLRHWFVSERAIPVQYAEARPKILPGIRSRVFSQILQLPSQIRGMPQKDSPGRPFAGSLDLFLVFDLPEIILVIPPVQLSKWGVSFDQALDDAHQNLREMSRDKLKLHSPGLWRSPWSDAHDPARLLLTEQIAQLPVKGDPVATVPNYCTLLVTGSDDVEGLERLASLSIQEFAKGKSITAVPLRFSGGTWTPFMPPEGHPHHNAFRRLELISLHTEYQEQSELLQQLKNATGDSALASGYELIRDTVTGKVSSLSRWPLGTELLVPITDVIEFVREGKDNEGREILGHTSWDRFQQMMGDELEPTNFYPPRFRIKVPAIKA